MNVYKIGVLKGDGIGPEIIDSTIKILKSITHKFDLSIELLDLSIGWEAIKKYDDPLPKTTLETLEETDIWILGPHDSASYPEKHRRKRNPSGELRHHFDLFSNVRPAKNLAGISGMVNNTDLVIYRENTEGFYADRNMYSGVGEFKVTKDVALTTGVFTREAVTRIAREAFKAATKRRYKVTIVHKANVLGMSSGLFLEVCRDVSQEFPDVDVDDYHIDAMAAHLVRRSNEFDVIVTENMFGDILSDLTGELVGSLGLAPSINTNNIKGMAQAAHGSAPDIAGMNIANPIGLLLSTAMLFEWLYERDNDIRLKKVQNSIEESIEQSLSEGLSTKDLGGKCSTTEFTEELIKRL